MKKEALQKELTDAQKKLLSDLKNIFEKENFDVKISIYERRYKLCVKDVHFF